MIKMHRYSRRVRCLAGLALIATPHLTAGPTFAAATQPETTKSAPIAITIDQILAIPSGSSPYLPSLEKIIEAAEPHERDKQALNQAFAGQQAEIDNVVTAINSGADQMALRSKILGAVNLAGIYSPSDGGNWEFGSLRLRMTFYAYLRDRASELVANGQKDKAAQYAKASLFLFAQEDVQMGTEFILQPWAATAEQEFRQIMEKSGPLDNKAMEDIAKEHQTNALLNAAPAVQTRLDAIYVSAETNGQAPKAFSELSSLIIRTQNKPDGVDATKLGEQCADLFKNALQAESGTRAKYYMLRNLGWARQALTDSGFPDAATRLRNVLLDWGKKAKDDESLPHDEKNALLRWIKEASTPVP